MNERLEKLLEELIEVIMSFFSRKDEEEGKKNLKQYREHMLKEIEKIPEWKKVVGEDKPDMGEVLGHYPHLGAVAFLGKFRFTDCPEVKVLQNDFSAEILETILGKKRVQVAQKAEPAWQIVLNTDKETACAILALCYLVSKKKKILKLL